MRLSVSSFLVAFVTFVPNLRAADYDPLNVAPGPDPKTLLFTVPDAARKREVPIRAYLPNAKGPVPVILFSHGLGGTRDGNAFTANHWARRGYVVVAIQHPGSDDAVWKGIPAAGRLGALQKAASAENLALRAGDVKATLDQLAKWNVETDHDLFGRLDLSRVGMSGHSFGAVTTQAVGGQTFPLGGQRFTDPRITAALAFSPSVPRLGDPRQAFGAVAIPWMLMTGTNDTAPVGGQTVAMRLAVYPNLPATIDKYELVLNGAEHSAFTDRPLPGDKAVRNPNHHRVILALSTAFWDAHLRGDAAARGWLDGAAMKAILEKEDRWQSHRLTAK
jgi:predicted dienelactone hydrolase